MENLEIKNTINQIKMSGEELDSKLKETEESRNLKIEQ